MDKRILIVEDDLIIAESHKFRLNEFGFTNCDVALSKEDAKLLLTKNNYQLVLLDVRLETHFEGIDLGNFIASNYGIPFIYLTAHSDLESVKKMVESKPISYLSKPVRKTDLFAAVSIVFATREDEIETVTLKDGGSIVRFEKSNLVYAQSSGNYINLKFSDNNKTRLIRMSLDTLLQELNDPNFMRISRFYVINLLNVEEVTRKEISIGGEKITFARDKYNDLLAKLT